MQLLVPTDFFPYFERDIVCEDKRSNTMPKKIYGLLIGITIERVQIRSGNNITDWYPLKNASVKFFSSPSKPRPDMKSKKNEKGP